MEFLISSVANEGNINSAHFSTIFKIYTKLDTSTRKTASTLIINTILFLVCQDERNQMMRLSVWVRQVGPNNLTYTKRELKQYEKNI